MARKGRKNANVAGVIPAVDRVEDEAEKEEKKEEDETKDTATAGVGGDREDGPVIWYAFYSKKHKREYYFEPKSSIATWIMPLHATIVPQPEHPNNSELTRGDNSNIHSSNIVAHHQQEEDNEDQEKDTSRDPDKNNNDNVEENMKHSRRRSRNLFRTIDEDSPTKATITRHGREAATTTTTSHDESKQQQHRSVIEKLSLLLTSRRATLVWLVMNILLALQHAYYWRVINISHQASSPQTLVVPDTLTFAFVALTLLTTSNAATATTTRNNKHPTPSPQDLQESVEEVSARLQKSRDESQTLLQQIETNVESAGYKIRRMNKKKNSSSPGIVVEDDNRKASNQTIRDECRGLSKVFRRQCRSRGDKMAAKTSERMNRCGGALKWIKPACRRKQETTNRKN